MGDFIQVTTTSDKLETLQQIASRLVDSGLAACVQIGQPVTSYYRWNDAMETTQEWTCSIKSVQARREEIESVIEQLHHYDVPQITVLPVISGSHAYLQWLAEQTRKLSD